MTAPSITQATRDEVDRRIREELAVKLTHGHDAILRRVPDLYRKIIGEALLAEGGATGKAAQLRAAQRALDRIANVGVVDFVDQAGRRWNMQSYVEMAVRTAAMRAMNDAHLSVLRDAGYAYVYVSRTAGSCPLCEPWESATLSIDPIPGGVIEVGGQAVAHTVQDALNAGLMHPGCRHRYYRWRPGTVVPPARPDSEHYEAQQQLRALERTLRGWKRRQAAAFTPEAKRTADAKVAEWQAAIRKHVDETGVRRLPGREQIDGPLVSPTPRRRPDVQPEPSRTGAPPVTVDRAAADAADQAAQDHARVQAEKVQEEARQRAVAVEARRVADQQATERAATEQAVRDRAAAVKTAADEKARQAAAEKLAAERAAAEARAARKLADEQRAMADLLIADRAAAEKLAARHASVDGLDSARRAQLTQAMNAGKLPDDMRAAVAHALSMHTAWPEVLDRIKRLAVRDSRAVGDARWEAHGEMAFIRNLFDPTGEYMAGRARRLEVEDARGGAHEFADIQAVRNGHATHADAVVAHELGHAVEDAIGQSGLLAGLTDAARVAGLPAPKLIMMRGGELVDPDATLTAWVKQEQVRKFLRAELSGYGSRSYIETVAEIWSVYSLDGASAPAWIRAYGETATRLMRERAAKR